ncbi:MAG: FG-GAP repeat domain-containing protein, partial [Candidatus Poribacteria bacterium]
MSHFNPKIVISHCISVGIILFLSAVFALSEPGVQYVDVTKETGINFEHFNGVTGEKFFLEALGAGAAFFDYDNDGDLDLYLVNGAPLIDPKPPIPPANALYRNNGDGTFTDVTK